MDKNQLIERATDAGAAALGDIAGAAIGGAIGGIPGAVAGAASGSVVGSVIKNIGDEVKARFLSKKENERIESVLELAKKKIDINLNQGKKVRGDVFFKVNGSDRSMAEEILEGTLLIAQKEYEEKKIPYIANLYANLAFNADFGRAEANQLLKIASELTSQQLHILSVIRKFQLSASSVPDPRMKSSYGEVTGAKNISISTEIYDLYLRTMVTSSEKSVILDAVGINPSQLKLCGNGANLFNLMELANMPIDENIGDIMVYMTGAKELEKIH